MDRGKAGNPLVALIQAAVALGLLIALPFILSPASHTDLVVAGVAALVLLGFLFEGIARFVRQREPHKFHDSVLPPQELPDVESTVIRPPKRNDGEKR